MASKKGAAKWYAVARGSTTGVFTTWESTKASVNRYPSALYKGFGSLDEACQFLNREGIRHQDIKIHVKSTEHALSNYCEEQKLEIPAEVTAATPPLPANTVTINVDGACINNGKENPQGGFGVYWGENSPHNLCEPIPSDDPTIPTNNRAELYAAIAGVRQASDQGLDAVIIRTDSDYVIHGITSYVHEWKKSGTLANRKNCDLWEKLLRLCDKLQIQWEHVEGHTGDPGNEAADTLANEAAARYKPSSDPPTTNPNADPPTTTPNADTLNTTPNADPLTTTPNAEHSCRKCNKAENLVMIQCSACRGWLHDCCTELPR